jgi:hypothetical protein
MVKVLGLFGGFMKRDIWLAKNESIFSFLQFSIVLISAMLIFSRFGVSLRIGIVYSVFLSLVSTYIYTMSIFKWRYSTSRYLTEECDPEKYLVILDLQLVRINSSNAIHQSFLRSKAVCLSHLGRWSEVEQVVLTFTTPRNAQLAILAEFDNLIFCSIHYHRHEYTQAQEKLDTARSALESSKLPSAGVAERTRAIEFNQGCIHMREGLTDGIEDVFVKYRDESKPRISKIQAVSALAELYRRMGRIGESMDCLRYVADHGNKTRIAEEARKSLADPSYVPD